MEEGIHVRSHYVLINYISMIFILSSSPSSYCSDYRGLKKRITAVRREREGEAHVPDSEHTSGDDPLLPTTTRAKNASSNANGAARGSDSAASPAEVASNDDANDDADAEADQDSDDEFVNQRRAAAGALEAETRRERLGSALEGTPSRTAPAVVPDGLPLPTTTSVRPSPGVYSTSSQPVALTNGAGPGLGMGVGRPQAPARAGTLRRLASRFRLPSFAAGSNTATPLQQQQQDLSSPFANANANAPYGSAAAAASASRIRPLSEIMPTLTATQKKFFDKLDAELEKIETFYLDREKEARTRSDALKLQLQGLRDHRRIFYVGLYHRRWKMNAHGEDDDRKRTHPPRSWQQCSATFRCPQITRQISTMPMHRRKLLWRQPRTTASHHTETNTNTHETVLVLPNAALEAETRLLPVILWA
jgi:hypothetical protein